MSEREILTVEQAAELLQVRPKTCRSLAARGVIPAFKLGKVWRFTRQDLEAWASAQGAANVRSQPVAGRGTPRLRVATPRAQEGTLSERLDALLKARTG